MLIVGQRMIATPSLVQYIPVYMYLHLLIDSHV